MQDPSKQRDWSAFVRRARLAAFGLNATANPNGLGTWVHFDRGTATARGNRNPVQTIQAGRSDFPVSVNLTGFPPNTTYHFRVVPENRASTNSGSETSFKTLQSTVDFAVSVTQSSGTRHLLLESWFAVDLGL